MDKRNLVTKAEAARALGVSAAAIQRLIDRGKLKALREGVSTLVNVEEASRALR